jgi:peptidoglycan/xylan/chitin deacetylase (PgdA/CDA1 family)
VSAHAAILMYHSVGGRSTRSFDALTVHPTLFYEQLAALREAGARLVAFAEAARALNRDDERPVVAITIDDALEDVFAGAVPALLDHAATATVFVPTAYVGGHAGWLRGADARRPLMSWTDLSALADIGLEIGSHGHRHLACDVNDPEVVRLDALRSRLELERQLDREVSSFAFPFGYGPPAARRAVRDAGFAQACVVADLPAQARDDRFALPRLHVGPGTSPEALVELVLRRPVAARRWWSQTKQRAWTVGRRHAGWGPPEASVVLTPSAVASR